MAFDRPSANGWLMAGGTLCSNTGQQAGSKWYCSIAAYGVDLARVANPVDGAVGIVSTGVLEPLATQRNTLASEYVSKYLYGAALG